MKKIILYIVFSLLCYASLFAQICPGEPGVLRWELWQNLEEGYDMTALYSNEFFPKNPDDTIRVFKIKSNPNYDNDFGSRLEGFLNVEEDAEVIFNITANYIGRFYLSTSTDPEDIQLIAYTTSSTGTTEHDKELSQTSSPINLVGGQDYYFLVEHVAGGWSDHFTVFWKSDFLPSDEWTEIGGDRIKGLSCLPDYCPGRGTPCDDNNSATENDKEDGHCNCIGTPIAANACIGEQANLQHYEYHNITGSSINDLNNAVSFPAAPDYSFNSDYIRRPYSDFEYMGSQLQAYLVVPVSGNYQFNITGDDHVQFFISSDSLPANKIDNEVYLAGWTSPNEHDKYPEQTSELIYLEANRYYYIELNHKQGSGGNSYQVFWKPPFSNDDYWKQLSSFYTYDYACELACIAQGTPCDDGDPYTNNDAYNDDCECTGTPCSGPDCDDPIASYVPHEKCGLTDGLDNNDGNNWLSCTESASPNPLRSVGHWLNLDLGEKHELISSHIWNYNAAGETNLGMQSVAIDYSLDGNTWTELGVYNWALADGSGQYSGFTGPDFDNVLARYVLITCLDNDSTCKGLGKIAIDGVLCPDQGTACDDNNDLTIDDTYDSNCNCVGVPIFVNDCSEDDILVSLDVDVSSVFGANNSVIASSKVKGSSVGMTGGSFVELLPGFETESGNVYTAFIADCYMGRPNVELLEDVDDFTSDKKRAEDAIRVLYPEKSDFIIIDYYISQPGEVVMVIEDENKKYQFPKMDHLNKGYYQKKVNTKKMRGEIATVFLNIGANMLTEEITLATDN